MWEYREEYVKDQDLIEACNFYGKQGWEVFQIEKDYIEKQHYGDQWTEIEYTLYMKKKLEK